ncbi:hypothetical protein, partial [Streptomyces bauhiniae]
VTGPLALLDVSGVEGGGVSVPVGVPGLLGSPVGVVGSGSGSVSVGFGEVGSGSGSLDDGGLDDEVASPGSPES